MTLNLNTTYTPKEALDADPNWTIPVKLGRGRMPKGGDEHCRSLVAQGYRIKGYEVAATSVVRPGQARKVNAETRTDETPAPVVKRAAAANVKEVKEFTILYDEKAYKAVSKSGKEYGMREVCNTCRVSLVQNSCLFPTILGGIAVEIKPR